MKALKKHIAAGAKRILADIVIKNCKLVNVFTHEIQKKDIAICDDVVVGIGKYEGKETVDANGQYAIPGLIDSHIHIESSMLTPEEFGKAAVPHGTTTIIADPHEIVNVCGLGGLHYMVEAAKGTALNIQYMVPSCVPCTQWEHNGATIDSRDIEEALKLSGVIGLGEFMDVGSVVWEEAPALEKIMVAKQADVIMDGHAPGIMGDTMAGYMAAGIRTDHECSTVDQMLERLNNGLYVNMRYGTAAKDLLTLVDGLTRDNARRCMFCSDDKTAADLIAKGHIDHCLREVVAHGVDPITAVQMATLNVAECYGLEDRGAIAPGRKADIVLVNNLSEFKVDRVWIEGKLVAENGVYIPSINRFNDEAVYHSVHLKDFSEEKLKLHLTSNHVHVMGMQPGSIISEDLIMAVPLDEGGELIFDPDLDVAKIAVVERHCYTGNVANALIYGYGIKRGAFALSVGHDSHNIVVIGTNAKDMACAVNALQEMGGGMAAVLDNAVIGSFALPIAGLMSDQPAAVVRDAIDRMDHISVERLGVWPEIHPMNLAFMSLPVIPEIKLTDMGLFRFSTQKFIPIEAEEE